MEEEVVEVLVGEVVEVLEVVEGSMVVGKVVVDYIAGTVVGIVVDNMVEAFEVVVVGRLDFVELGYVGNIWVVWVNGLGSTMGHHVDLLSRLLGVTVPKFLRTIR